MRPRAALAVFALSCTAAFAGENTNPRQTSRERGLALEAKACEAGDVLTCLRLATRYAHPSLEEVPDTRRARHFYKRATEIDEPACAAGDLKICERLEQTFRWDLQDRGRAMAVWRVPCRNGAQEACATLARLENKEPFGATTTFGARWGQPIGWSGSVALVLGPHSVSGNSRFSLPGESGRGLLLQIEPGVCGGKIGLGLGTAVTFFGPPLTSGAAIKLSFLRGWSDQGRLARGNDYVGAETDLALLGLKASAGLYKGVGRDRGPLFTFGVGVGF